MIGQSLSHFKITAKLGEGGMGQVYRAEDTKLGREVAIKLLPEEVASQVERLARFEREAKVLAALNHPHVGAIYGLDEHQGRHFLVLELVEGTDLAEHLERGALPVDKVVAIARQIAEALEAAHERGIVHRDLKPANVKLTPDGQAKVLDFGLAKAGTGADASGELLATQSPTITQGMTAAGVLLGTAAYMSPEQARGQEADKRSDIFSFGVVLYEMLTGERGFGGDTITDTLAAILKETPDLSKLPDDCPHRLRHLIERCLEKNPRQRLRDIGEARIALDAVASGEPEAVAGVAEAQPAATPAWRRLLPWSLLALVLLTGIAREIATRESVVTPEPSIRLDLQLERPLDRTALQGARLAISRDGSHLVYVGEVGTGTQLFLRRLGETGEQPIPHTEDARSPFLSPDGEEVAFYQGGVLKRVRLDGTALRPICTAPSIPTGGTWSEDDVIVFTTGVYRIPGVVSAAGGEPELLATEEPNGNYEWPYFLPDNQRFLAGLTGELDGVEGPHVVLLSLADGSRRVLMAGNGPRYLASGHILFSREGRVYAVPFDPDRGELTGAELPLPIRPRIQAGLPHADVSDDGLLIYDGSLAETHGRLIWVGRDGSSTPLPSDMAYFSPRLSPDRTRIVASFGVSAGADIWMLDLASQAQTRLTFSGLASYAVWSPDGETIYYTANRDGAYDVYSQLVDSDRDAVRLTEDDQIQVPTSVSPDGKTLLYYVVHTTNQRDIWALEIGGEAQPVLVTSYNERAPVFSPDGRWFAYVSDESGEDEIYVRQYPDTGNRWRVSSGGGTEPVWNPSGGELLYRVGDALMSVPIELGDTFRAGRPREIFRRKLVFDFFGPSQYDVDGEGERLLMVEARETEPSRLDVVLNWDDELERLLAAEQN